MVSAKRFLKICPQFHAYRGYIPTLEFRKRAITKRNVYIHTYQRLFIYIGSRYTIVENSQTVGSVVPGVEVGGSADETASQPRFPNREQDQTSESGDQSHSVERGAGKAAKPGKASDAAVLLHRRRRPHPSRPVSRSFPSSPSTSGICSASPSSTCATSPSTPTSTSPSTNRSDRRCWLDSAADKCQRLVMLEHLEI